MDEKKYMIRTDSGYFKMPYGILYMLNNELKKNPDEKKCVDYLYRMLKRRHAENVGDFCTDSKDKASILTDELAQFFNNNNEPIKLDRYSYYYIIEIDRDKEFEMRIDN